MTAEYSTIKKSFRKRPSDTAQGHESCWWMLSVLPPPHVRAGRGESRAAPCWGHVPFSPSSWGRFPFVKQGLDLAALGLGAKLSERSHVSPRLTLPADTQHLQLLHRVSPHAAPSHAAHAATTWQSGLGALWLFAFAFFLSLASPVLTKPLLLPSVGTISQNLECLIFNSTARGQAEISRFTRPGENLVTPEEKVHGRTR